MTTISPLELVMVVWRQFTSFTTPAAPPTEMLSPGDTMRSKLTCTPPMRLEMVSWKPNEMAIPPMPSAVIAADTSTPKHVDSTTDPPTTHTMARPMLMKIDDEGSSSE